MQITELKMQKWETMLQTIRYDKNMAQQQSILRQFQQTELKNTVQGWDPKLMWDHYKVLLARDATTQINGRFWEGLTQEVRKLCQKTMWSPCTNFSI